MKHNETRRGNNLIGVLGITVLALLMLVSTACAAPYAYITNSADDTISVIDTATNAVTATVPVGDSPAVVAVTPDGSKAYVANRNSANVSVIDTATNTVTATVPVGVLPNGIVVTPEGKKVYVTNAGDDNVSVIDTATDTVVATVPVGDMPFGVASSPDGTKVYVANDYSNTVSVIDTATNAITTTVPVGVYPHAIAVTPDGKKVYLTYGYRGVGNTVSVIDTATNTITSTVNVGNLPVGVAVTPDGKKVYVTNLGSGTVSVIDTATYTVKTIVVGNGPYGVAVTLDGRNVYVAHAYSNIVSVIDTATNNVTSTVNVGQSPQGVAINPLPKLIFPVVNFNSNVTEGYAPLSVQFTDLSEDSTSRTWDFENDGIIDSTEETPVYVYANSGTYTVNLTATNENGTDSKTATINVLKAIPTITWGNPADIIYGTALSSTQLNAVASVPGTFVYTPAAGTVLDVGTQTLHVDFTPSDPATYNTTSADAQINVLEQPVIPVADFSASPTTGKAPLTVTFTDKSTGSPTSWSWNFGDKSTSIDQSPVHTYSKAGKYTVSLTVKNELGNNIRKISNYILVKK